MSLLDQIKSDIKDITSNEDEFARSAKFTAPNPGAETATVGVVHTKHHMAIDQEGVAINSKDAHIAVSEELLTAASYPVRKNGEVDMVDHKVEVIDSTGIIKTYVIRQSFPDETIGLIVCLLGDFT